MAKRLPKYSNDLPGFLGDLRSHCFSSQQKAADYVGVKRPTITRYENGVHLPPVGYMACLAQLLTEQQEEAEVALTQEQLVSEVNQAIRDYYPDDVPIQSWAELCAVADEYLTLNRNPPAKPNSSPPPPTTYTQRWAYNAGHVVTSVALSADGETMVVGTWGKKVIRLDRSGSVVWVAEVSNQAWRTAIDAEGEYIVAGTGSTRPWDLGGRGLYCFRQDGSVNWQVDLKASVWGLAIAGDGSTIAVGTSSKQLILFDNQGHQLCQQAVPGLGPYAIVWSTALSSDGQVVAAGAADKHLRLLNRNGVLLGQHRLRGDVFSVAVSADGDIIAAGDSAGYIYLFHRDQGLLWEEALSDKIWAVALNSQGTHLFVGAGEQEAHVRAYHQAGHLLWRRYVKGDVSCLAASKQGGLVAVGTATGQLYLFDGAGDIRYRSDAKQKIRDIAISPTGDWVLAGAKDGFVYGISRD